ncbi:large subunit of alpha-aminoadipate reductase [Aspergillus chevalieri]|uniref:Large subunit of alpha-aminoadipate reductase n=1 Tax=Aspergillus chevalieri TaxID=182096 RepID=A0A7R7VEJ3_ASPCH|nr:large subunit of alpha-aminoadipate reductase [Aspergillus chevalieri]BCR83204.1 large subunit of alpha-aminoadipate reductase [Aspergillus chevalieri]
MPYFQGILYPTLHERLERWAQWLQSLTVSFLTRDSPDNQQPDRHSEDEALERIRSTCRAYGFWNDVWTSRLQYIFGDLGKPQFHLSDSLWDDLTNCVNAVIHTELFSTGSTSTLKTEHYVQESENALAAGKAGVSNEGHLEAVEDRRELLSVLDLFSVTRPQDVRTPTPPPHISVSQVTGHPRLRFNQLLGALQLYGYNVPQVITCRQITRATTGYLYHFVASDLLSNTAAALRANAAWSGIDASAGAAVTEELVGLYASYLTKIGLLPTPTAVVTEPETFPEAELNEDECVAHTQLIKSTLNISTVEAFGGNSAFGTSWDFAAINLPRTTAPVHRPVKHSPFPS